MELRVGVLSPFFAADTTFGSNELSGSVVNDNEASPEQADGKRLLVGSLASDNTLSRN